jgi:uncharacterized repeat protein (TIGR02543 family)
MTSSDTAYADWSIKTFTITYADGAGTGGTTENFNYNTSSSTVAANAPTITPPTGYDNDGWSPAFTTVTSNKTYTAQFTPETYTVTFNENGGNTPSPTSKTITYGSTYGTLATVSRSGYDFDGWFTASSGGSEVTSGTTVSTVGDRDLWAQWTVAVPTQWVEVGGSTFDETTSSTFYGGTTCPVNDIDLLTWLNNNYPVNLREMGDRIKVLTATSEFPTPTQCADRFFEAQ